MMLDDGYPGETHADWRDAFRAKLVSADDAVRRIKSGDLVRLQMGPVPVTLVNALARRRDELHGVRVLQGASRHPHPWATAEPGWEEHIQFVSDFVSVLVRPSMTARRADFAVVDYGIGSKVQSGGRRDGFSADVFMALVSAPDADGFVSFGFSLWHSKQLLRSATLKIAEVGEPGTVLRTCGDNRVHLSEFDLVVEQIERHVPLTIPELSPERKEVTEVIGAYVSTLVNDGDTLQVGTGTLSSCMGSYLTEKRDLGIDSEILVASVIELIKQGVATGRHKTQNPGVATGSFVVPGADFDFCSENPRIELREIAVDGTQRYGVAHRGATRSRHGGDRAAHLRRLRHHRIWDDQLARPDAARTGNGADRNCPSGFSQVARRRGAASVLAVMTKRSALSGQRGA